jgi:predicted anti-sigma-YlaC factor YlaD
MSDHVQEWLNAYLDGELAGWRLERVENHLAGCSECRTELEALRRLSHMVQQVPLPGSLPSAERFAAQVMLRLPRRQARTNQGSMPQMGWYLAPAALLVAWAFLQAVSWLSTGIWTAGEIGLLGDTAAWLAPEAQGTGMLTGALQWLGVMPGGTMQQIAGMSEGLGWNLLLQLVLEGGLALLYLGWLVTWWQRRQHVNAG